MMKLNFQTYYLKIIPSYHATTLQYPTGVEFFLYKYDLPIKIRDDLPFDETIVVELLSHKKEKIYYSLQKPLLF